MKKELVMQLKGEYLKTYQQISLLCQNISFFMDDSDYFKLDILSESLDLLLEAQVHQQPVQVIFGDDLYQFIKGRYLQCYNYSFSYSSFMLVIYILYLVYINVFSVGFEATIGLQWILVLLCPIVAHLFYLANQTLCLKLLFKTKIVVSKILLYAIVFGEMSLYIFFMGGIMELNKYNAVATSGWFVPILIFAVLSETFLKGLDKSKHHYQYDELFEQYLDHCHFLKSKRRALKDIPLTNKAYFTKLEKKHRMYHHFFWLVVILQLISFGLFMSEFEFNLFNLTIIFYFLYSLVNLIKYYQIKEMLKDICLAGKKMIN